MESSLSEFGQLLQGARQAAGLSRAALAERVGLDASHLFRIEKGSRHPSRESALAFAEVLQITGDSLNQWLVAAGFSPSPLLSLVRGAARVRARARRPRRGAGHSSAWDAANWAAWLDAMGLQENAIVDLLQAMQSAPAASQQAAARTVRAAFSRVTASLAAPVHTAIIPAAGGQHRLLAAHVMQRLLLRAVREAAEAGIGEVILVLAPGAADHLYLPLQAALEMVVVPVIKLHHVEQPRPEGLGDAILHAEPFVGGAPTAVLLPDDVVQKRAGRLTAARDLNRMADYFRQMDLAQGGHIVAVANVLKHRMPYSGVVELGEAPVAPGLHLVTRLVEKPNLSDSICHQPGARGIVGRYLLHPDVFDVLRAQRTAGGRPLHLTNALEQLRQDGQQVYALDLEATRQDVGEVLEQANELLQAYSEP